MTLQKKIGILLFVLCMGTIYNGPAVQAKEVHLLQSPNQTSEDGSSNQDTENVDSLLGSVPVTREIEVKPLLNIHHTDGKVANPKADTNSVNTTNPTTPTATQKAQPTSAPVVEKVMVKTDGTTGLTTNRKIDLLAGLQSNSYLPKNEEKVLDKYRKINIYNYIFTPLIPTVTEERGTLLLSDSPEYVGKKTGILYEDRVTGENRVYFYHVNEAKEERKMAIVVKNVSPNTAYITVIRSLDTVPTDQYFAVGSTLSKAELEPKTDLPKVIRLQPGERALLAPNLEKIKIKKDQLFSGIVDFKTTDPLQIKILMLPYGEQSIKASILAPTLPYDDVRLRGSFVGMDRDIVVAPPYNPSIGPAQLELANGREDFYVKGIDATVRGAYDLVPPAEAYTVDTGNYGVRSTVTIPTKGKGSYDMYFNPLGGAYAGAIEVIYKGKSSIVMIPEEGGAKGVYLGHNTVEDTQLLGTYDSGTPITLRFMPAGASNLPIRILFVPHVG